MITGKITANQEGVIELLLGQIREKKKLRQYIDTAFN